MKLFLMIFLLLCSSTSVLLAGNGTNLIGHGPISNALGGVGIALPMNAENILKNPAVMNTTREFDLAFGATYLSTSTSTQNTRANMLFEEQISSSNANIFPSIGFTHQLLDNLVLGLAAFETTHSSVDYRDSLISDGLYRTSSSLSVYKISPALAFSVWALKVGIGVQVGQGSFSSSMYDAETTTDPTTLSSAGEAHSTAYGFNAGAAFWIIPGLNIGVSYQSAMTFDYKPTLTVAADNFSIGPRYANLVTGDKMSQPSELGFGFSFIQNRFTISADYKIIGWSSAAGYKELGWDDQNVIAVGLAANILNGTTLRVGFNSAKNPQGENASANIWNDASSRGAINTLNMLAFPALSETHYTFGLSQIFSRTFSIDLSAVISPEVVVNSPGMIDPSSSLQEPLTTKQSTASYSLAGHWMF